MNVNKEKCKSLNGMGNHGEICLCGEKQSGGQVYYLGVKFKIKEVMKVIK